MQSVTCSRDSISQTYVQLLHTLLGQAPAVWLVKLHWDVELGGQAALCEVDKVQIQGAYV